MQGTEEFVPAKGGATKSALEVISRRKEFLVAASLLEGLLTEPIGNAQINQWDLQCFQCLLEI